MVNVVHDSEGDVFSTRKGELRLVLGKQEGAWMVGRKRTGLTILDPEANERVIYQDLGVYAGQRIGTPCDDM